MQPPSQPAPPPQPVLDQSQLLRDVQTVVNVAVRAWPICALRLPPGCRTHVHIAVWCGCPMLCGLQLTEREQRRPSTASTSSTDSTVVPEGWVRWFPGMALQQPVAPVVVMGAPRRPPPNLTFLSEGEIDPRQAGNLSDGEYVGWQCCVYVCGFGCVWLWLAAPVPVPVPVCRCACVWPLCPRPFLLTSRWVRLSGWYGRAKVSASPLPVLQTIATSGPTSQASSDPGNSWPALASTLACEPVLGVSSWTTVAASWAPTAARCWPVVVRGLASTRARCCPPQASAPAAVPGPHAPATVVTIVAVARQTACLTPRRRRARPCPVVACQWRWWTSPPVTTVACTTRSLVTEPGTVQ